MITKLLEIKKYYFFILFFILSFNNLIAQTPGMIFHPATGSGKTVLDPNGDGYTSATSAGFTTDDQAQSEIPFVSLIFPMVEPTSDLGPGPDCGFTDFVDEGDEDPVQAYLDGTNWLFRMRMGKAAPNAKSYSILIDTDGKFGGTGPNKDPEYSSSNPGFEIEIVLATKFGVFVYDVNNMNCSPVISYIDPLNSHYQKSIALTTNCGDPDYFYDFFVNFNDLTTKFGITTATPVRMAIIDNMAANKSTLCSPNSASDLAGLDDSTCGYNLESCFGVIVDNYTPCAPGVVCPDRSKCPGISSVNIGATTVSGTSTEANGTLIIVYKDGVSIGSTSVSSGVWTLSGISPALASAQVISATATAPGKGVSIANCNPVTVAPSCTSQTSTLVTISKVSGNKGFDIVNTFPTGTVFTWYNSDFTLAQIPSGYGWDIPNPVTTIAADQMVSFECKTGQCFNSGMYYFTFKEPNKCVSNYLPSCLYSTGGTTGNPSFTTSSITINTTSISGTVAFPDNVAGVAVYITSNGAQVGTATTVAGGGWTINGLMLSGRQCQTLSLIAIAPGKCVSTGLVTSTITRKANAPIINGPICSTAAITSVSGKSNEAAGTTIQVFENGVLEGTTTVASNSTWTASSGINIAIGSTITAKAIGTCLSLSDASNSVVVGTLTTNAVTITPSSIPEKSIVENTTSVSGTGTSGNTIKLYIDGYPVFQDLAETTLATVNVVGGTWTINNIYSQALYAGGTLTATATSGTNCEGVLSDATSIVCLKPLKDKTVNPDNTTVCSGSVVANVQVEESQDGVIYQLYNNVLGANSGSSVLGTGFDITLTSSVLTANTTLSVKAIKSPFGSCTETLDETVIVTVNALPTLTGVAQASTVCSNSPATINLSGLLNGSTSTIAYSINGASQIPATNVVANGSGSASFVTSNLTTANNNQKLLITGVTTTSVTPNCSKTFNIEVTLSVISGSVGGTLSAPQTICAGSSPSNITLSGNTGSVVKWQKASDAAFTSPVDIAGTTTTLTGATIGSLTADTYFRAVVQSGSCSAVNSASVLVTVNTPPATPTISTTTSTTFCSGGSVVLTSSAATGNQWYKDAVLISGATNTTYSATASGDYTVISTNGTCPSSASAATTVTVNASPATPTISTTTTTTFCSGGSVVLTSSAATGNQWYKDAVLISGATSTTYSATASGDYTVISTNGTCPSAASAATTVTVNALPSAPTVGTITHPTCALATGSIVLNDLPTGNWTINPGNISGNTTSTTISGLAAGITLKYTVRDDNGCESVESIGVKLIPAICAKTDIIAAGNGTTGNTNAGNVLGANPTDADQLNGTAVVIGDVNLTVTTGATPKTVGAPVPSIDVTTGIVSVPANTPVGTYTIVYQICEKLNPSNCSSATATVTVGATTIQANADTIAAGNGTTGNTNAGNVLGANPTDADQLNGTAVMIGDVNLTVTTGATPKTVGAPVPSIDVTTGIVSVPANTPAGTYTIVYQICEKLNPSNCSSATATITVDAAAIKANSDTIAAGNGTTGNTNAGNVLGANPTDADLLNGTAVVIGKVNLTVTAGATPKTVGAPVPSIDVTTGIVSVPANTPVGTYTIVYQICEKLNPSNCSSATATVTVGATTIQANADTIAAGNGTTGNTNAGNVLGANPTDADQLNGTAVVIGDVNLTVTTGATPKTVGAPVPSIDVTTGTVSVPANTPVGTYTIVYQICEKLNPSNCSSATATVTVGATTIQANADTIAAGNGTTGNTNAGNVLGANPTDADQLNGTAVMIGDVNLTVTTGATPKTVGAPVPSIDVTTGIVSVPANTPAGTYTIVYQICEKLNPSNCSSATATITVDAAAIKANSDTIAAGNGTTGNTNAGNVLGANPTDADLLNGTAVVIGKVNLTVTAGATPKTVGAPVPSIDVTTGIVSVPANTPVGTYTIVYQICEKLNPSNCSSATATVTVGATTIQANSDTIAAGNGTTGNTNAGNVLGANPTDADQLNGTAVMIGDVNLTVTTGATPKTVGAPVPSIDVTTGIVSVPANTPAGTYTIVYQICEKLNPSNCSSATATITVDAAAIKANSDTIAAGNGTTGNTNAGNVLGANPTDADLLNGTAVVIGKVNLTVTAGATPKTVGAPVPSIDVTTGIVSVPANTPVGTYTIVYQICEKLNPSNCSSATATVTVGATTIQANADTIAAGNGTTGNTNAGNVLGANPTDADQLNGTAVVIGDVNLTVTTGATPKTVGAPVPSIDVTTGTVSVPANTPFGTYTIVYQICEKLNPSNCSSATATVTVGATTIQANADTIAAGNGTTGNTNAGNVLGANPTDADQLNGTAVMIGDVNLTVTTGATPKTVGAPVPSIDVTTGIVSVPANTPAGTYTIVYQICEKLNPSNCSSATATITVDAAAIKANSDTIAAGNGTTGNTNAGNVLGANPTDADLLNGTAVVIGKVNLTVTAGATPKTVGAPVPSIDVTTGIVSVPANTPVGTYTIVYQICEKLNPANCDEATVTINVTNSIPIATLISSPSVVNNGTPKAIATLTGSDVDGTIVNFKITVLPDPTQGVLLLNGVPVTLNQVLTLAEAAQLTFLPAKGFKGVVSFGYSAIDNEGDVSIPSTVKFTVSNEPPTANSFTNAVLEKNGKIQSISPLTGNDIDGVVVAYVIKSLPDAAAGMLTLNGIPVIVGQELTPAEAAILKFTPNINFIGSKTSFTIVAKDNGGLESLIPAIITIPLLEKPSIALVKKGVFNDNNKDGFAQAGETITYSFTITNTGNVPLTNVFITDLLPGLIMKGNPIQVLGVDEVNTTTFTAIYALKQSDIIKGSVSNQAKVTGTTYSGLIVYDLSDNVNNIDDGETVLGVIGCVIDPLTGMSPNGDGENDVFYIRGIECYPDNNVQIFNRWGVKVFERDHYNNSDIAFRGISEGRTTVNQSEGLPEGTYYYILNYKDSGANAHQKAGYFYINR
ncbi:gliding motility-associated C-terminal domain-containing protein [Flavobacterium sp. K5-23]|uniref:T9SS type B sorting domain-containing protein n=1 Tax=Flavobacterium sp. K5-23 TaxID=2746225 RepID=UPI00200DAC3F|nr:gliding motility-associated C-terminal domain-containing protein [Flavobacterium sp. K5-23]UQD55309.1 gliding motility-associated C-terminal domain-containing protein [Flavobacterium sp. K5-23]